MEYRKIGQGCFIIDHYVKFIFKHCPGYQADYKNIYLGLYLDYIFLVYLIILVVMHFYDISVNAITAGQV